MCIYIFAGRFQPFHNGHLQVLEEIKKKMQTDDTLVIGVVSPFVSENKNDIIDQSFIDSSIEHHLPERNPWDVSIPLSAVSHVVRSSDITDQVITTLLPRPEYGWHVIKEWFPGKRVWVIPRAGEEFDDKKAAYFEDRGDRVIRIDDTSHVSGRELREYYKNNNYEEFSKNVPEGISEIYFKDKFDDVEDDFQHRAKSFERSSRWVVSQSIIPNVFFRNRYLGDVLDAGGGTGYLLQNIYNNYKEKIKSISLVDISYNMILKAKEKRNFPVKAFNMSLEVFSAVSSRKYDTILARQVLHYVDNVDEALYALKHILKDDGILYVGQIIVEDDECKKWHDKLMNHISKNRKRTFTKEGFIDLFDKYGFEIIKSEYYDYEENLNDLFKRRAQIYAKSRSDSLLDKMNGFNDEHVIEKMKISTRGGNLFFTVKFAHLFLQKKVNHFH